MALRIFPTSFRFARSTKKLSGLCFSGMDSIFRLIYCFRAEGTCLKFWRWVNIYLIYRFFISLWMDSLWSLRVCSMRLSMSRLSLTRLRWNGLFELFNYSIFLIWAMYWFLRIYTSQGFLLWSILIISILIRITSNSFNTFS